MIHLLTNEHLFEEHRQPVLLISKPVVRIRVCCSYVELPGSKLHKVWPARAIITMRIDTLMANILVSISLCQISIFYAGII